MNTTKNFNPYRQPWGAVDAAHKMVLAKVTDWTEADLVPLKTKSLEGTFYRILSCLVPLGFGAISTALLGWSWWQLVMVWLLPKTYRYFVKLAKGADWTHFCCERDRTKDVYRRVCQLQHELEFKTPADVTPEMVRRLEGRYQREIKDRRREYILRRQGRILGVYKEGDIQFERDKALGWAADDVRFNFDVPPVALYEFEGGGKIPGTVRKQVWRGRSSDGWSGNSGSARRGGSDDVGAFSNDYPMGHFNPANGMPMTPGGVHDVTGHVFGTSD